MLLAMTNMTWLAMTIRISLDLIKYNDKK